MMIIMNNVYLKTKHLNKLGIRYCSNARKIPPPPQNEKQRKMREEFWKQEQDLESKVFYFISCCVQLLQN